MLVCLSVNQLLQSLLYQAVKVIKTKAPSKHKTQVAFMTTQSAVKVRKEEKKKSKEGKKKSKKKRLAVKS